MNLIIGLGIVGVLYLFVTKAQASVAVVAPQGIRVPPAQASGTLGAICGGLSMASQIAATAAAASGDPAASSGSGGQCGGGVAGMLLGSFMAASAQRRKQAINENSAVAAAVPGWDRMLAQVVTAYNQGKLSANDALNFLASPQTYKAGLTPTPNGTMWQIYWSEVGPQIQPERNGCQSGAVPHGTTSFCGGSYGAACCVGYDDLDNSCLYVAQAIVATEQDGAPHAAKVLGVYGSKYGGISRPIYSVTVQKPGIALGFAGQASGLLARMGL